MQFFSLVAIWCVSGCYACVMSFAPVVVCADDQQAMVLLGGCNSVLSAGSVVHK